MHPNAAFRREPRQRNLDFARTRGFGQLSVAHEGIPLAAHVPFALAEDGTTADLHLLRSNPIAQATDSARPALLAVTGPDGYVSPDWYGVDDQVPTWNYIAIHLRGTLLPLPPEALRDALDRLTAIFESRLLPKSPWTSDKMPEDLLARMMRTIRPYRFAVESVDGTWKLNQNKPAAARHAAAGHMGTSAIGQETRMLGSLMREAEG